MRKTKDSAESENDELIRLRAERVKLVEWCRVKARTGFSGAYFHGYTDCAIEALHQLGEELDSRSSPLPL